MGEGGWGLLAGWIVPAAIAVVASMLLIFPPDLPLMDEFSQLDAAERTLILAFASVAIGFVLSAAQTTLYRLLEGYMFWPEELVARGRAIQRERKGRLQEKLREAQEATGNEIQVGLLEEKLNRYPVADGQTAPTALGNAIRAFETYGDDRYHLDSQTFWYELNAAAPESLQKEVERARVPVDFCVASFFLLIPFGLLALIAGLAHSTDRALLLVSAVVAFAALPAWYRLAVSSVAGWGASVQALVNVGRIGLAEDLGLSLPETIAEEREMWDQVRWFAGEAFEETNAAQLDRFRKRPPQSCWPTWTGSDR
jgi:hypothetical protein